MKKKLFILCITICIGYGIICPDLLAKSAANGLYLWYHSVLPTLLPFGILSGIILRTGMYDAILERISPFLKGIYPLRPPLFYPLIAGYLFGFPLGSKLCADLYDLGKISKNEAIRVSCISNNFGPAFVVNYVLAALPEGVMPDWMFLAICYGKKAAKFTRNMQTNNCQKRYIIIHTNQAHWYQSTDKHKQQYINHRPHNIMSDFSA